jgi:hydrogenase expression/formation protein HypE
VGKLPVHLLQRLLAEPHPLPSEVLVGPAVGEDACALSLGGGTLVVATDPITLTDSSIGRHAVMVNANDIAVMGVQPKWFLATVLLPPGTGAVEVEGLFSEIRAALAEVGASLVGGHSEVTPSVVQPLVVGQMLGFAPDRRFLSTAGTRPGDVILQIGPVPVEGTAVLAGGARDRLAGLDAALRRAAQAALDDPGISVVTAALTAAALGATALHDPTEGGLAAALNEMAGAAGVRLRVDRSKVLWFEPGLAVCSALGADPWAVLASGSLLAAFAPADAEAAAAALGTDGRLVSSIATAVPGTGVVDTEGQVIAWPQRDEVNRLLEPSSPARTPSTAAHSR